MTYQTQSRRLTVEIYDDAGLINRGLEILTGYGASASDRDRAEDAAEAAAEAATDAVSAAVGAALYIQDYFANFTGAYDSRATAIATSVPVPQIVLSYVQDGQRFDFASDADGTALVQSDGRTWSPAGNAFAEHYGAVGDGVTSDSGAINAALAFGDNVYLRGRPYLLTEPLSIKQQKLIGAGYDFPNMSINSFEDFAGTVLICGFDAADYAYVINLEEGGKVSSLVGYYPNQLKVRPTSWVPTTTPWFITGGSYAEAERTVRDEKLEVSDVGFIDFTHGIQMLKGGEQGFFERIRGNPFTLGLWADALYDVTRFRDFHFWPFGGNTGTWQVGEREWTLNNGTAFMFGRVDGLMLDVPFCIGYRNSCWFIPCQDTTPAETGTATTNFHMTDVYFDQCDTSLLITGAYTGTNAVTGKIQGGTMQHWSNTGIVTERENIYLAANFGDISLSNVTLAASGAKRKGRLVRTNASTGVLSFNNCTFQEWDSDDAGGVGFLAQSGTTIILNNPIYQDDVRSPFDPKTKLAHYAGSVREVDLYHGHVGVGAAIGATLQAKGSAIAIGDSDTGIFQDGDGVLGFMVNGVIVATYKNGKINTLGTPVYADNAAAKAAGLVDGDNYRTATGAKMEVYT